MGQSEMSGSAYYLSFIELSDVIGPPAATKLVADHGGQRFYVRERLPDDHFIIASIGKKLGHAFAAHIATGVGGMPVEIPMGSSSTFKVHRLKLRELAADYTLTEAKIADQLGVHMRTVRRMRATLRAERNHQQA